MIVSWKSSYQGIHKKCWVNLYWVGHHPDPALILPWSCPHPTIRLCSTVGWAFWIDSRVRLGLDRLGSPWRSINKRKAVNFIKIMMIIVRSHAPYRWANRACNPARDSNPESRDIYYSRWDSNPQPSVPKTDALPLSHWSWWKIEKYGLLYITHIPETPTHSNTYSTYLGHHLGYTLGLVGSSITLLILFSLIGRYLV